MRVSNISFSCTTVSAIILTVVALLLPLFYFIFAWFIVATFCSCRLATFDGLQNDRMPFKTSA